MPRESSNVRIANAIKLLDDFATEASSTDQEPEQDEWWDLLYAVLKALRG